VQPIAIQGQKTIIGNRMWFESKGSKQPIITNFYPGNGNSGDTINIEGRYFSDKQSRIHVFIGVQQSEVIYADSSNIKFLVPLKPIKAGAVELKVISGMDSVTADDIFIIDGQKITGFNPKKGIIGETNILIEGSNFLAEGNIVNFGPYKAEILSESETEILVKLPYTMTTGLVPVTVDINGKVASSADSFEIRSRWKQLENFPGKARIGSYSVQVDSKLIIICGGTKLAIETASIEYYDDVWIFDLNTEKWEQAGKFPGKGRQDGIGFILDGTIFYGLGIGENGSYSDFWKLDTQTMQWTQLINASCGAKSEAITFSILSKGYMIVDQEIWMYDPTNDMWTFVQSTRDLFSSPVYWYSSNQHITFENIGYIFLDQRLYIFDPNTTSLFTLIKTDPFVYLPTSYFSDIFVLNNQLIFNSDINFFQIDLATYSFNQIESFPGAKHWKGVSTSFQNKAYIGLGYNTDNLKITDNFYVYDSSLE
jgi:hypothetical protein